MTLIQALLKHQHAFHPVIPKALQFAPSVCLNLSEGTEFQDINLSDTPALIERTQKILKQHNAVLAIGRYAEKRTIYKEYEQYNHTERSIHLGIDLMAPPHTPVYAPLDAVIHSFKDNAKPGDYGPTIILQHELENTTFYTLYGHLTRDSLKPLVKNQVITGGCEFAKIGETHENGRWPPHLHFQVITDIGDYRGDFPGVIDARNKQAYLTRCPDPNYILGLKI